MAVGTTLLVSALSAILIIVINAVVLWLTVEKILGKAGKGFKVAFTVALISGIVSFLLSLIPTFNTVLVGNAALNIVFFIITAAVMLFLIRKSYAIPWGSTIMAWLVVTVIGFVAASVVGAIIGLVAPA